eukprot:5751153-Prymnesium_polylepis.1
MPGLPIPFPRVPHRRVALSSSSCATARPGASCVPRADTWFPKRVSHEPHTDGADRNLQPDFTVRPELKRVAVGVS